MNENEMIENEQNMSDDSVKNAQSDFIERLQKVNSSYLTIVIVSAAIAACGIAIAILLYLWLGVAVAFASALIYMLFTKLTLRKNLGISYESTSGALSITKLCSDEDEIFIPSRLLWIPVTTLEKETFECENAKIIHLPATLTVIGENVFSGCDSLTTVCFEGSEDEWERIESLTSLDGLEMIFCDSAKYDIEKPEKKNKTKKDKKAKKTDVADVTEAPDNTEDEI